MEEEAGMKEPSTNPSRGWKEPWWGWEENECSLLAGAGMRGESSFLHPRFLSTINYYDRSVWGEVIHRFLTYFILLYYTLKNGFLPSPM
jgi:hypothetical protein